MGRDGTLGRGLLPRLRRSSLPRDALPVRQVHAGHRGSEVHGGHVEGGRELTGPAIQRSVGTQAGGRPNQLCQGGRDQEGRGKDQASVSQRQVVVGDGRYFVRGHVHKVQQDEEVS